MGWKRGGSGGGEVRIWRERQNLDVLGLGFRGEEEMNHVVGTQFFGTWKSVSVPRVGARSQFGAFSWVSGRLFSRPCSIIMDSENREWKRSTCGRLAKTRTAKSVGACCISEEEALG